MKLLLIYSLLEAMMKTELDPKPFLLYETVEMLTNYMSHISFLDILDTSSRVYRGYCNESWYRRLGCLQRIMEDCCADLDPNDKVMQRFFRRTDAGCVREPLSLAWVMTLSFMQYVCHDLKGEAEVLKDCWRQMQAVGFRVNGFAVSCLEIIRLRPGVEKLSLFQQIYALDYPAEFRLEVLHALQNYDAEMYQLVSLLEPYARRLESHLEREPWLMDSTVEYWQELLQTMTPEEYLGSERMLNQKLPIGEERRICFSLMCGACIFYEVPGDSPICPQRGIYVFGSGVLAEGSMHRISGNADRLSAILRSVSEKNKFEILRRLALERSYCQKLAEEMHCDTGNLSRNLAELSSYGFLRQEREQGRVYYSTDLDSVYAFLEEIKAVLGGLQ